MKRLTAWDRAKAQIAERDAAIARLQEALEAAEDEMPGRDQAALGRLERKNAEIARLRKERDAARKRLSALQPRISALETASPATEAKIRRLERTEVLLKLTEPEKVTPPISAVHIVVQLRQWLKARAGRDSSEATTRVGGTGQNPARRDPLTPAEKARRALAVAQGAKNRNRT